MSEEEKEAIKYLEFLSNEKCECEACQRAKKEYKTILNLIDKQQKEIKKEKNRIMELAELLDKQENEIKFLEGELEIQKGCSVSRDEIREKIKEYRKETMLCQEFKDYENANINQQILLALENLLEENQNE